MRGHDVYPEDFINLLEALPGGLKQVRTYLTRDFGILVGRDDAYDIWTAIERERGEQGAADVVAELVISRGGDRVHQLIAASSEGRELYLRADDPQLARLLFQEDEDWRDPEVGYYVVDYYERSRPAVGKQHREVADDEFSDRRESEPSSDESAEEESVPDILSLFGGKPRPSAMADADWSLVRVQTPRRGFLTVPSEWSEAQLEEFLWLNWERLDLALDFPLHLVEKQVSLSPHTSDRVDFLARGPAGEWVAIELKIGQARRGDLTQLLSYMADLERRGEARELVRGVLIAAGFGRKLLNAVAAESRISLLSFQVD